MELKSYDIVINPNPIQKQFIESQAKADLFSSRMGEGKSAGLCFSSLYHVRHNPGADHYFIRDTWENIRDTTLQEFFHWFPPGVCGHWNESKKVFTWADGFASGQVHWLGMDDPNDVGKLQSRQMAAFFVDEPAPAAQSGGIPEMVFDIALSRLRQPNMHWYAAKLATNNPDETHWTYRRFVDPGTEDFVVHQTIRPENEHNLPADYYANLRKFWMHRPDLIDRFIEGKYGFVQEGKVVTPEWSDKIHLATGLAPIKGIELVLLWDFGLNPTCIVTQVTPFRQWNILDAVVGDDIGCEELIEQAVKPLLAAKYRGFRWRHIGDPNGAMKEQSRSTQSATRVIRMSLGGTFRPGPISIPERVNPLRAILRATTTGGHGIVQVDRTNAREVWQALRGGWHYHVAKSGVPSLDPVKDRHSHPGDAMGYGAAILFPLGRLLPGGKIIRPQHASFFGTPGVILPKAAQVIPGRQ